MMFRELRRKNQLLSQKKCIEVLNKQTHGVLALGDGCYPYTLPISYLYDDGKIYFHCGKSGHKMDVIKSNSHVSFCVVDQDEVVASQYTTYFRSVIVFGNIRIVENNIEKRNAIDKLMKKYAPNDDASVRQSVIEKDWDHLCMLEMNIEHMSGKQAVELMKKAGE